MTESQDSHTLNEPGMRKLGNAKQDWQVLCQLRPSSCVKISCRTCPYIFGTGGMIGRRMEAPSKRWLHDKTLMRGWLAFMDWELGGCRKGRIAIIVVNATCGPFSGAWESCLLGLLFGRCGRFLGNICVSCRSEGFACQKIVVLFLREIKKVTFLFVWNAAILRLAYLLLIRKVRNSCPSPETWISVFFFFRSAEANGNDSFLTRRLQISSRKHPATRRYVICAVDNPSLQTKY
jgi:hypothetical protein